MIAFEQNIDDKKDDYDEEDCKEIIRTENPGGLRSLNPRAITSKR